MSSSSTTKQPVSPALLCYLRLVAGAEVWLHPAHMDLRKSWVWQLPWDSGR